MKIYFFYRNNIKDYIKMKIYIYKTLQVSFFDKIFRKYYT